MHRRLYYLLFTILFTVCGYAQHSDPVLFKINGEPVYKTEVEQAYNKGISSDGEGPKVSFRKFVDSYIDFKLNVIEAKSQQVDTAASYRREISSFRSQLIESYMPSDTLFKNAYSRKIYDRMLENVEVNHVMIPFKGDLVLPSDTIEIYKKISEIRTKILKDGFDIQRLGMPKSNTRFSVNIEDYNGYIGWVAPFMLSVDVEDAVYSMPMGEISQPIRSDKGYHIVQVLAKRPSKGFAEVEQVMFNFSVLPATQHQIDSVRNVAQRRYSMIKSANDFQSLCYEYAKAYNTQDKGCYFGIISVDSKLPPAFTSAVYAMEKVGDISEPILSDYGFHIIRLLDMKPIPTFDEMKGQINGRIAKSDKARRLSDEKRSILLSHVGVKVNEDAYDKLLEITASLSPADSIFLSKINNGTEILIDIEGKRGYTVNEFAKYIRYRQEEFYGGDKEMLEISKVVSVFHHSLSTDILKDYFNAFLTILISSYYEDTLDEYSPEFRRAMDNVTNDMLFFAVKDKNVWANSKADEDGLVKYFAGHRRKYTLNGSKFKGIIIYAKDEEALQKAEAIAKSVSNKKELIWEIKEKINEQSVLVQIESGIWSKGDNLYIDNKIFGSKVLPVPKRGYPYSSVVGKFISKPEDFNDVRGQVESDYQQVLEKEWSKYLKNKYNVELNKSALNAIK